MHSITLDQYQALSVASVGAAAAATGHDAAFSPVLSHIRLSHAAGNVTAVATDRYRVARSAFTVKDDGQGDFTVLLPAKEFLAFVKSAKKSAITIQLNEAGVIVSTPSAGMAVTFEIVTLDFPAVERLFPSEDDFCELDRVTLDMAILEGAKKLLPSYYLRASEHSWTFRFMKTSNPRKPGPVYMTLADGNQLPGESFVDFLIQPKMALS